MGTTKGHRMTTKKDFGAQDLVVGSQESFSQQTARARIVDYAMRQSLQESWTTNRGEDESGWGLERKTVRSSPERYKS